MRLVNNDPIIQLQEKVLNTVKFSHSGHDNNHSMMIHSNISEANQK